MLVSKPSQFRGLLLCQCRRRRWISVRILYFVRFPKVPDLVGLAAQNLGANRAAAVLNAEEEKKTSSFKNK